MSCVCMSCACACTCKSVSLPVTVTCTVTVTVTVTDVPGTRVAVAGSFFTSDKVKVKVLMRIQHNGLALKVPVRSGNIGMMEDDLEDDTLVSAVIPHFVLERVVKCQRATLCPRASYVGYAHPRAWLGLPGRWTRYLQAVVEFEL